MACISQRSSGLTILMVVGLVVGCPESPDPRVRAGSDASWDRPPAPAELGQVPAQDLARAPSEDLDPGLMAMDASARDGTPSIGQDSGGPPVGLVDLSKSPCFNKPANKIVSLKQGTPRSFNAGDGMTYDARGQTFKEPKLNGSGGILLPRGGSNHCIVGVTLEGPVTESVFWNSSHKPDGIQHSNSKGPYMVYGAWLTGANDALSPPKPANLSRSVTFAYHHIYVKQCHDDVLENDICLAGVIKDSLFDAIHMGFSSRPGRVIKINTPRPTVRIEDTMVRMVCQKDTRPRAAKSSCPKTPYQMSHSAFFKGSSDCQFTNGNDVRYVLKNVILRADHRPIYGAKSLRIPADAQINNVTVIYLGPDASTLPKYPAGVKVITDKTQGEQVWNNARDNWLARHGCDAKGGNCAYLKKKP